MQDNIERYIRNMRAYYEKLGASTDFIDQMELQVRRLDLPSDPLICPHCSEDIDEGDHGSCNQHAREEARDAIEKARDE